jgi:hypothetical protein
MKVLKTAPPTKKGHVWRKAHTRTLRNGKTIKVPGQWVKSVRTAHYKWAKKQVEKKKKEGRIVAKERFKTPKCKKGEIVRKGYVRKAYTKTLPNGKTIRIKRTVVAPVCVKDVGLPGKGARVVKGKKQAIGPVRKGALGVFGYSMDKSAEMRRKALKKAVKEYGRTAVLRKVNAIVVWNKYKAPTTSKKATADVNWIKKTCPL